jgi:hypothetical protein
VALTRKDFLNLFLTYFCLPALRCHIRDTNCTSPVFAGCLNALIQPNGHEARHVRFMPEYGFAHNTDDIDWITRLSTDAAQWIIVTGDQRIRKHIAERAAIQNNENN